jgi:hypothetical protein
MILLLLTVIPSGLRGVIQQPMLVNIMVILMEQLHTLLNLNILLRWHGDDEVINKYVMAVLEVPEQFYHHSGVVYKLKNI